MWKLFIILLFLTGCAKTTPTSAIVEEGIKHIDETIDYVENNIAENADTVFLTTALKSCRASLVSCDVACSAEKETLASNISYWRLACTALSGLVAFLLYLLLRKK